MFRSVQDCYSRNFLKKCSDILRSNGIKYYLYAGNQENLIIFER